MRARAREGAWILRLACLLTASALSCIALSDASAEGIALRWQACVADGGISNLAFACNTNSGVVALVPSFVLDAPRSNVTSVRGVVDIVSESATLPAWWELDGCRNGAVIALNSSIAPLACGFWSGPAGVNNGIHAYVSGIAGPNTALLDFGSRLLSGGANLSAGPEYVVTGLRISLTKTVGSGSCDGCGTGVCFTLKGLSLQIGPGQTFVELTTPMPTADGNHVTWQGGGPGPGGICDAPVATRRSAWGAIKSLYR